MHFSPFSKAPVKYFTVP